MSKQANRLDRRQFFYMTAMTAVGVALSACGATPTATPVPATTTKPPAAAVGPTMVPTTAPAAPAAPPTATAATKPATPATSAVVLKEAPELADLVKSGKLPPVAERVSQMPQVLTPIHGTGEYGGTLRTVSPDLGGGFLWGIYSYSPVRYIKDGTEIAPGMCESWETNASNSEWTLHFRKGLKWSDGSPCTVDDVMFWWNDLVTDSSKHDAMPDFGTKGGATCEFIKVDDYTLKIKYSMPSPITLARLAGKTKALSGPRWILPAAYLKQFHPKYNKDMKDWSVFDQKADWSKDPNCPTLSFWKLDKIEPGVRRLWVRNPYCYNIDNKGNQLPYISAVEETMVKDVEVQKLNVIQGKVDYLSQHKFFFEDLAVLRDGQDKGGYEVRMWDSGSGTGMIYYWNYDHPDDKKRALYRNPSFKRAMSHALDRKTIQRIVYYDSGYPATGTVTPKAVEFNSTPQAKAFYAKYRDAYVEYNVDKAKALLDSIGVKDVNGDGFREMPDGSKLDVRIDLNAAAGKETMGVLELATKNWQAVGLRIVVNQMPLAEFNTMWNSGKGDVHTDWECTGTPMQLDPADWLLPKEPTRWAPLCGNKFSVLGTATADTELDKSPWDRKPPRWASTEAGYKDGPVPKLEAVYNKAMVEVDPVKRNQLVLDIWQLHMDEGPFLIGTVANYQKIVIVSKKLINVPSRDETGLGGIGNTSTVPTPAIYWPETWAFKKG